jgi:hypothetical protein
MIAETFKDKKKITETTTALVILSIGTGLDWT